MPGTREGGIKSAKTKKLRYGDDYYKKLGSKGGKKSGRPKGFAYMAIHDPEKLEQIGKGRWAKWKK